MTVFNTINDITISKINFAMYVPPGTGRIFHKDRRFHGLVMNDLGNDKIYKFSDGSTINTTENSVFYLPKNSTYAVETDGICRGCWAINFTTIEDLNEKPFVVNFKNSNSILENFKSAVNSYENLTYNYNFIVKKNLYDIILKLKRETSKRYELSSKNHIIKPAIDAVRSNFSNNSLTVSKLSSICGISENYFRRIFSEEMGMSPKEYIISLRIARAKALIQSGQFTISEIAEMCGYYEPCHFSREFSKKTGISPKQYQSQIRRK